MYGVQNSIDQRKWQIKFVKNLKKYTKFNNKHNPSEVQEKKHKMK